MFTNLLISTVQQHPNELRVEDADWGTVAKDQRIVDVVEPVMNERRLIGIDVAWSSSSASSHSLAVPNQGLARCLGSTDRETTGPETD
jgi:hypothetical protein